MPDQIVIKGVQGCDGRYDFDATTFTNRELHTIKRLSGIRAGELAQALAAGDSDMLVALAVLALQRSGRTFDEERLWDADMGSITYEAEDVEEDALPPAVSGEQPQPDGSKTGSSGSSGTEGLESSQADPRDTGMVSSEPSSISLRAISAS